MSMERKKFIMCMSIKALKCNVIILCENDNDTRVFIREIKSLPFMTRQGMTVIVLQHANF